MYKRITAMFFSPTGTTGKIAREVSQGISAGFFREKITVNTVDFTLPKAREEEISFANEDIVVLGVPVYAGRVPNILLKYLNTIKGNGALAIAVVVYGNRHYDDAAVELEDILAADGFRVIAAGAFVGEHAFSKTLAKDRPDEKDMNIAREFAKKIYGKIAAHDTTNSFEPIYVEGVRPYRKYYMPKNEQGIPVDIRKVAPKTSDKCIDCKLCAQVCPMGSINYENVFKLKGICIKCGACIKKCPVGAKYYDDEDYLRHKHELEINFAARREPELFLS